MASKLRRFSRKVLHGLPPSWFRSSWQRRRLALATAFLVPGLTHLWVWQHSPTVQNITGFVGLDIGTPLPLAALAFGGIAAAMFYQFPKVQNLRQLKALVLIGAAVSFLVATSWTKLAFEGLLGDLVVVSTWLDARVLPFARERKILTGVLAVDITLVSLAVTFLTREFNQLVGWWAEVAARNFPGVAPLEAARIDGLFYLTWFYIVVLIQMQLFAQRWGIRYRDRRLDSKTVTR